MAKKRRKVSAKNACHAMPPKDKKIDLESMISIEPTELLNELESNPNPEPLEDEQQPKTSNSIPMPLPQSMEEDLKEIILSLPDNEFDSGLIKIMLIQCLRNQTKLEKNQIQLSELIGLIATHVAGGTQEKPAPTPEEKTPSDKVYFK